MEWQKDFDHRSCDKSKASLLVTGSLAFSGVSWSTAAFPMLKEQFWHYKPWFNNVRNIYEVWHIGIVKSSVNVHMPRCCRKTTHVIPRSYSLGIFFAWLAFMDVFRKPRQFVTIGVWIDVLYDPHSKLILKKNICLFSSLFGEMIQFDLSIFVNWVGSTTQRSKPSCPTQKKTTKNIIIIPSSSTTQLSGTTKKTQMFCFGATPVPPHSRGGTWNPPEFPSSSPTVVCCLGSGSVPW